MASKKQQDKKKAEAYLKKLEIAKTANSVNPFESNAEKQARINRAKNDVEYMVKTYLPHYATADCADFQIEFAEMVEADPLFKGFAEWGRGLAKSCWCNIIIPLWLWMRGEDIFFCLKSDSYDRAEELLADIQSELEANPLIINDFGEQKMEGSWELGNFITKDYRFIGKAFGIKQKVRGVRVKSRRPNIWVIDDLETPDTISNPKRMRKQADHIERDIMATMTGSHRRLLYANNKFARVMTQTILQERHPKWVIHQIKAYNKATYEPAWKSMFSPEFYQQQEEDMGIPAAYAEYNHETKLEGSNFNEDDIQWAAIPEWNEFEMIIVHWDIAYTDNETSDYNAVKAWGLKDRKFYLIDSFVKQCKMKVACNYLCDLRTRIPQTANVLFQYEAQFWNEEVQRNTEEAEEAYGVSLNIIKIANPNTNKLGRMLKMVPYYQNSRIYYNEALKSHNDTQVGIMQLCSVEEGSTEHDDSPDADQQAISALDKYTGTTKRKNGEKSWKTGRMKQTHKW
jgi:predicted phage terminase large subunit-like protein